MQEDPREQVHQCQCFTLPIQVVPFQWPEKAPKPQRRILDMHRVYGCCEGRRCKTCGHFRRYRQSKTWFKCRKSRTSNSEATDWRANWPACGLWFCRGCNGDGRDSLGDTCQSCGGVR